MNLGSGMEISIRDLMLMIAWLTGFEGEIVWDTTRPNGQPRRKLDTSRAKALVGFESYTSEEGLWRTSEWYHSNRSTV